MKKKQSTLGILALIFSIIGIITAFFGVGALFGIIALILGIIGLAKRNTKKVLPLIGLILGVVSIVIALASLGSTGNSEPDEVVYVDEADIDKIYGDANAYKGKYVKLTGQVFNHEVSDGALFLQINEDIENYDNNTLVYYYGDIDLDINDNDYVAIDGYITGSTNYSNIAGGTISAPEITAKSIEKLSYIDAVVPTLKSVEPNITVDNNGYKLTLNKVEFAEKETRCYFTFENSGNNTFTLWNSDSVLIQNSKQYEMTYNYDGSYEELPYDIQQGVTASGILTFDGIQQDMDFSITMSGYDEEAYVDYDFKFEVSVN